MVKQQALRQQEEQDVNEKFVNDDNGDSPLQDHGQQSSGCSLLLWIVPSDTFSTFLSPLLGTQYIIGTLSLIGKAFHTIADEPATHLCFHVQTAKAIHLTDRQLSIWLTRLSKTKSAVLLCPVTESMGRLVEARRHTLNYLEMDYSAPNRGHTLLSVRQGASLVEFPVLEEARVGGDWALAAPRKRWALRSLVSLSVRDCRLLAPVIGFGVWWRSLAPALRSLEYDDDGCWGYPYPYDTRPLQELLRITTSVPDLSALKTLRLKGPYLRLTHEFTQQLAQRGLRLEDVDIALRPPSPSTPIIKEVDAFRKSCLAPNAIENWSRSDFRFRLESLYDSSGVSDQVLCSCADTIKTLASAATEVSMSTHLGATEVFYQALHGLIPSLVFSRTRTLLLTINAGHAGVLPLPDVVLSNVARLFPSVTHADVSADMSDALVQRVLGQLPTLETLNCSALDIFDTDMGDEDWARTFLLHQTEHQDRPIAERVREATTTMFWEESDHAESFIEACDRIASMCMRAIRRFSHLDRLVITVELAGDDWKWEGQEGGDMIVATMQEGMVSRPGTPGGRRLPFHLLLREFGFELVELPRLDCHCRMEVRRMGVSIPSQKRITDYFPIRQ
ncbi:unnamed protein product [Vitrella brassicaformis CCMP3155]|uniref:Uncharacterized protein n=2 Tax=Vitrella brassicaformis TaxID=1169539 RepID=A0A0G4GYQ9_VITBC|nr:unnamed protein product [Vitrella brassicaformis CCMP3155]|eukprot:CEM36173.1 unnamed protein product [Vitrella brassicaformis CCMP3155]